MMTQSIFTVRTRLSVIALLTLAWPVSAATVTLVDDDFESPPHTAGSPPAAVNGFTVASTGTNKTVLVVNTEQSDFGEVDDTQAAQIVDNDDTAGVFGPRLNNTTALPTNRPLIIQFDYKLNTLSQNPSFVLFGSGSTPGLQLGFAYPGSAEIFYTDGSNTRVQLGTAVAGDWYRATMHVDPLDRTEDSWDLRLQRHDGTSVVSDQSFYNLDFRNDITGFQDMRWLFNTGPAQGGDFVVDNVSIQVVPTPAALPAGLMMLGLAMMRRRAH